MVRSSVFQEDFIYIINKLPCIFRIPCLLGKITPDVRPKVQGPIRICSRTADTAHNVAWVAMGADSTAFHFAFPLFNITAHVYDKNIQLFGKLIRCEHPRRSCAYDNDIIFFFLHHDSTSGSESVSFATFISRAIRRPIDRFSSMRSEYGEPEMKRFVPATMRADISKTFNSSVSVTTVSRQNGPIMPPNNSSDLSTTFSPISKILGRSDSRIIRGRFPVTTKVGYIPASASSVGEPILNISSAFDSTRLSMPRSSSDPILSL